MFSCIDFGGDWGMHTYAEHFSENFKDFQFADMQIEFNVITNLNTKPN